MPGRRTGVRHTVRRPRRSQAKAGFPAPAPAAKSNRLTEPFILITKGGLSIRFHYPSASLTRSGDALVCRCGLLENYHARTGEARWQTLHPRIANHSLRCPRVPRIGHDPGADLKRFSLSDGRGYPRMPGFCRRSRAQNRLRRR